jgi:hypothetical protein
VVDHLDEAATEPEARVSAPWVLGLGEALALGWAFGLLAIGLSMVAYYLLFGRDDELEQNEVAA